MKIPSGRRAVIEVVKVVQDNIFLREVIKHMRDYILENNILSFSSDRAQQKALTDNYFMTLALDSLEEKNVKMGVETPWGKDAAKLAMPDIGYFEDEIEEGFLDNEQED